MLKSRQDKITALVVTALLLTAWWLLRYPPVNVSTIPLLGAACGLLRPLIYMGFCGAWSVSISRTVINRELRFFLQTMAFCCILWLFLRTVKFELTIRGSAINIALMYAYNIPYLALPTFGFFSSLYARRGEGYHIPRAAYMVVSCLSVLALVLVLTNPFHKLYWPLTSDDRVHGIGYFVVNGWVILLSAMGLFNIILRTKVPGRATAAVLPLVVIGIIIGYFTAYALFPDVWKFVSNDWTSFTCLSVIGLMQACIASNLLPSNRGYARLFEVLDDGAIITDDHWNVCYASAGAEILPKALLQETETGIVEKDPSTLLKGWKLHPGHVVWKEDITAMAAILKTLEENRRELRAKNELDAENNRTALALAKAQEKKRLHDRSQAATARQNALLGDVLLRYFEEEDARVRKVLLAEAALLGAYIKRSGNLVFAGDGGTVKASELHLCFRESLESLELLPADCHIESGLSDEETLSMEGALLLYGTFQAAVERLMPDISAAFVRLAPEDKKLRAIYSFASAGELQGAAFPEVARVTRDEDTWMVSLAIPKGGEGA